MRPSHLFTSFWIMLAFLTAAPNRALAQGGPIEVAAGYALMRDYDGDVTFPRGWFASVAADTAGPLSLVGDVSGSYESMGGLDIRLSMSVHTYTGGPRLVWRGARAVPFVQMLFGVARMATTYEMPEEIVSGAQNHFVMAPGGGLDVPFSARGAFRVGANLRLIRTETSTPRGPAPFTYRELQFVAGIVLR